MAKLPQMLRQKNKRLWWKKMPQKFSDWNNFANYMQEIYGEAIF